MALINATVPPVSIRRSENRRKQTVNLALTVLEITAPVFLLAGVGFAWVKAGFEYRMEFVSRLAMTLAVPCLVFTALMQTQIDPAALSLMTLAAFLAYGGVVVVMWLACLALRLDLRTYLAPLTFGNTGNLGLPLALFAFGDTGLGYALVVFAATSLLAFTFGLWVVAGGGSPLKAIKEPLVVATLLGALFLVQGWETPTFLTNTLSLIGQMAIPMMLITLGVAVARLNVRGLGRALALALMKVVACSAVALAVGLWLGLDRVPLGVLILQIATPVAVTSYLLAEKYKADAQTVAALVVVSTVLSVITIPLTLAFFV